MQEYFIHCILCCSVYVVRQGVTSWFIFNLIRDRVRTTESISYFIFNFSGHSGKPIAISSCSLPPGTPAKRMAANQLHLHTSQAHTVCALRLHSRAAAVLLPTGRPGRGCSVPHLGPRAGWTAGLAVGWRHQRPPHPQQQQPECWQCRPASEGEQGAFFQICRFHIQTPSATV